MPIVTEKALLAGFKEAETKKGDPFYWLSLVRIIKDQKIKMDCANFKPRGGVLTPVEKVKEMIGAVVEVKGDDSPYNGKRAFRVDSFKATDDSIDGYVESTILDVEAMMAWIYEAIEDLQDPIKIIVEKIIRSRESRFKTHPAAQSLHHAYVGGLIEHTSQMLDMAKATNDIAYAKCDPSVVCGAVILHDVGKIIELNASPGIDAEYSERGQLIGHIAILDGLIREVALKLGLNPEAGKLLHLRHCCLAHHGRQEWGSPVVPKTPEAILVHQLDLMNSRGQMAREAYKGMEEAGSTNWVKGLDCFMYHMPK